MAPVVIMFRIIFCAVPAFMRVEPEMTSGPTSATMAISAAAASGVSVIAGDGGGVRAAGAGVGHGGDDIGRAAGGGDADHHVFARGAAAGDVALAQFLGVFVDFDRRGQRLGSAGHDVLHLAGSRGVGGRAFGGVEGGDAAAGAGADVDQPAAVAQTAGHLIDHLRDLRDRLLDRGGDLWHLRG